MALHGLSEYQDQSAFPIDRRVRAGGSPDGEAESICEIATACTIAPYRRLAAQGAIQLSRFAR
jgi:hypothetical protein